MECFPAEVWARVLPHAWTTLSQARDLQLVCRTFLVEAEHASFWMPWLARRRVALLRLLEDEEHFDPVLADTIRRHYVLIPAVIMEQGGIRAVVQSKLRLGARGAAELREWGAALGTQLFEGGVDRSGQRHGPAMVYSGDGDVFEGILCDGLYHGTGMYRFACGMRYQGGFHQQFRHGTGRLFFTDGSSFESSNFCARVPATCLDEAESLLEPDPESSTATGWLLLAGEDVVLEAWLETCGFEWTDPRWQDEPLFRIETVQGRVFAVRASLGHPEEAQLVYRKVSKTWEFVDRWANRNI